MQPSEVTLDSSFQGNYAGGALSSEFLTKFLSLLNFFSLPLVSQSYKIHIQKYKHPKKNLWIKFHINMSVGLNYT